ncbi:unnamed protein product [Boreogadus saida]
MNALMIIAVRKGFTETFKQQRLPVSIFMIPSRLQSTVPVVAARIPCRVKVSAGKRYSWCACGHSKKQPFCDGAHKTKAPGIPPVRFTPEKDGHLFLCACKQTGNQPYCDGTHLKVILQDVVKSVKNVFKS